MTHSKIGKIEYDTGILLDNKTKSQNMLSSVNCHITKLFSALIMR